MCLRVMLTYGGEAMEESKSRWKKEYEKKPGDKNFGENTKYSVHFLDFWDYFSWAGYFWMVDIESIKAWSLLFPNLQIK